MTTYPIQLIAGLANPGKAYAKSRHNAGAWLIEALIKQELLPTLRPEKKFHGAISPLLLAKTPCWLLRPSTYMNNSGLSIKALSHFYNIPPEAILVVHDDLDLAVGIARFKQGGGEGGHHGLKDIVNHLHSHAFWRLRIGIGHPGHRDQVHDYVLTSPSSGDRQKIDAAIHRALEVLFPFVQGNERQKAIQTLHHIKEE